MDLIWKKIKGFEDYSVSSAGLVRRDTKSRWGGSSACPGKILRQKQCCNGYRSVSLYPANGKQKQLLVHRLVAKAFVGQPKDKIFVNHKNGQRDDNAAENLEWVTPSENVKMAYTNGTAVGMKGENNPMAKINQLTADAIRELFKLGWNKSEISRAMRVDTSRVHKIISGRLWT